MVGTTEKAHIVIVGGGAIGLSIAYHLGKLGIKDVVLLERNQLTSGTSWHAAGIVGPLRASMNLTTLAKYAIDLFTTLESETGQETGYKQTGGLWLAQQEARLTELKRISAMGDRSGLDTSIISPDEIRDRFNLLHCDDLYGGMWVEQDGQVNPVDLCMAYAKGAKANGVIIRENSVVTQVEQSNGAVKAVVLQDGSRIECDKLVNCAGSWARLLGELSAVNIPLISCEHIYVVTDPVEQLPAPCPIVRDLDGGIYIKEDSGKLVLGTFESNPKHWQASTDDSAYLMFAEDWDHVQPMIESGIHRLPVIGDQGITHFMNGPESFTPDTKQVMGEVPELKYYFVAAGFNSIGVMSSAGVGKVMAEWIRDGEAPMDLWEVDITRIDPLTGNEDFLKSRLSESVHNQFDMHWPYKQFKTGRNLRQSTWHELLAQQGAVFGAPTGWERPLWFAKNEAEKEVQYSYGDQSWWTFAQREALHCQQHVSLFELSPFTKIEVEGEWSLDYLQYLCSNDIDVKTGVAVYTFMLNHKGGIEAELTVTRLSKNRFWITSGAATRFKDLYWIRKHMTADSGVETTDVQISDITETRAVLGIMGPKSRDLMQCLSNADFSDDRFPFSTAQKISIDECDVIATRLSFVGELGWELSIPVAQANRVYQAVIKAGEQHQLAHAGHFCLDCCRLEKGYRHWGHDMGAEDTPLEIGLKSAVRFDKSSEFIGKQALLSQQKSGCKNHQFLCEVKAEQALLLHDEPVYSNGTIVGHCSSGGIGFRTGKVLCLIMVHSEQAQNRKALMNARYEIEIAGERYDLQVLENPPYKN